MKPTMLLKMALAALALALAAQALAESLYDPKSFRPLTGDRKAFRVGDMLTVQIAESATATSSADTATRRKNGITAGITQGNGKSSQVALNTSGDFDGGGHTQRTNRFLATVTVTVREVLANGDLVVEGKQLLSLNDEQQTVRLQGRVRQTDISDGNVVLSTRLADANIMLVGDGDLSERQRRSWWRRIVDWIGL